MKTPHIVMTHQYPLDAPGGGTQSCVQIINHLQKLGTKVTSIQVSSDPDQGSNLVAGRVISVKPNQTQYLLTGYSVAQSVKSIIAEETVNVVLGWNYETAFLPGLLKQNNILLGMIAAMPSYEDWLNRNTNLKFIKDITDDWFRWRQFRAADVCFASSDFTKRELSSFLNVKVSKISVVGRGIDDIFFNISRSPSSQVSNFIFYGSLAPNKGIFDAIEALGIVSRRGFRDWKLKIAGWGDLVLLKEALKQHAVESNVEFLGRLGSNELAQHLVNSHLALLPSRAESFGRSIAEAQASGLPVISYHVGSIPEIIEHGITGLLVPAQRSDLLADAIIHAMSQPDVTNQMGMAARRRMSQLFSWEKTAGAILSSIENAQRSYSCLK